MSTFATRAPLHNTPGLLALGHDPRPGQAANYANVSVENRARSRLPPSRPAGVSRSRGTEQDVLQRRRVSASDQDQSLTRCLRLVRRCGLAPPAAGQQAARLVAVLDRDGERPAGRARCCAQHTNMHAGQELLAPGNAHETASHRGASCLVACPVLPEGPEVPGSGTHHQEDDPDRARGTGGSPLKVIWLFRQRSRLPRLCWGNGLALSKWGVPRTRPWVAEQERLPAGNICRSSADALRAAESVIQSRSGICYPASGSCPPDRAQHS
jgi:hypothetical protein